MRRYLALVFLSTLLLFARYEAPALKACNAYNNLKHTKNTHHVQLDPGRKYLVLNEHKGQKLILIKGEQPAQRWVDTECVAQESKNRNTREEATHETTDRAQKKRSLSHRLLALSWHNAFCQTHRYKKECKRRITQLLGSRRSDDRFVLHGLWPQPRSKAYCGVPRHLIILDKRKQWHKLPEPPLSKETQKRLAEVMPGYGSGLHRHEWIKHGTCSGKDAEHYFKDAIALTEEINSSPIRDFFVKKRGKIADLAQIRLLFDRAFGKGAGRRVALQCKSGLITELWLDIGSEGNDLSSLLKQGKPIRSRCKRGRVDEAGYGLGGKLRGMFGR